MVILFHNSFFFLHHFGGSSTFVLRHNLHTQLKLCTMCNKNKKAFANFNCFLKLSLICIIQTLLIIQILFLCQPILLVAELILIGLSLYIFKILFFCSYSSTKTIYPQYTAVVLKLYECNIGNHYPMFKLVLNSYPETQN